MAFKAIERDSFPIQTSYLQKYLKKTLWGQILSVHLHLTLGHVNEALLLILEEKETYEEDSHTIQLSCRFPASNVVDST